MTKALIKALLSILTCLFLLGCSENTSPLGGPPGTQGSTNPADRNGEWESSGVDDLAPEAMEEAVVMNTFDEGYGILCLKESDKSLNEDSLKTLNDYSLLKDLEFSLLNFDLYKAETIWSEIKEMRNYSAIINKILERLENLNPELADLIKLNMNNISKTTAPLLTEEVFPDVELDENCHSLKFAKRNNISKALKSFEMESQISDFVFERLDPLNKAALIIHEALFLSLNNSDFEIPFTESTRSLVTSWFNEETQTFEAPKKPIPIDLKKYQPDAIGPSIPEITTADEEN